jgi:hypothetical protein
MASIASQSRKASSFSAARPLSSSEKKSLELETLELHAEAEAYFAANPLGFDARQRAKKRRKLLAPA